jgi:hypothetical protein
MNEVISRQNKLDTHENVLAVIDAVEELTPEPSGDFENEEKATQRDRAEKGVTKYDVAQHLSWTEKTAARWLVEKANAERALFAPLSAGRRGRPTNGRGQEAL